MFGFGMITEWTCTQMHPSMSNNVSDQNSRVNEGSSHALSAVYHIIYLFIYVTVT